MRVSMIRTKSLVISPCSDFLRAQLIPYRAKPGIVIEELDRCPSISEKGFQSPTSSSESRIDVGCQLQRDHLHAPSVIKYIFRHLFTVLKTRNSVRAWLVWIAGDHGSLSSPWPHRAATACVRMEWMSGMVLTLAVLLTDWSVQPLVAQQVGMMTLVSGGHASGQLDKSSLIVKSIPMLARGDVVKVSICIWHFLRPFFMRLGSTMLRYARRRPPLLRCTTIQPAVWSRKTYDMLALGYTYRDYTSVGTICWLVCFPPVLSDLACWLSDSVVSSLIV